MTAQNDSIVRLDRAVKTYAMGRQVIRALNEVSLDFRRGSFWAVMGSSGSGKSTLLNILGCLDRLASGIYRLEGSDVSALSDDQLSERRLRHIGFIFQSFNLIPQLSVQRNIELPLQYLGWDAEKSRARGRELARKVGLEDRLDHRPAELSGGQMQRVAIARALANDPALLLADEPTGNLDSATGAQIMRMLSDLHREGKTIVMVTHEPDVACYADHRLHMKDGRIDRIETA